ALGIGRVLKARVRAGTGLVVSVGIGPGKMVAKIASDLGKPDGLVEVPAEAVEDFLRPLPVGRLWGVGPVTQAALARAGIRTIGDLAGGGAEAIEPVVGRRVAEHLVRLAWADDSRAVDPDLASKSYGEEGTFGTDVREDVTVRAAIVAHADAVARRLRRDAVRARVVVLKMKLAERLGAGKFRLLTRRATLPEPTDDGVAISDVALALWTRHRPARAIRLVGVTAAGIVGADDEQLALFPGGVGLRRAALNRALDRIVARFGQGAIGRGGPAVEKGLTTRLKRGE